MFEKSASSGCKRDALPTELSAPRRGNGAFAGFFRSRQGLSSVSYANGKKTKGDESPAQVPNLVRRLFRALALPVRAILSLPLLIGFLLVGMAYDRENKRRWGR